MRLLARRTLHLLVGAFVAALLTACEDGPARSPSPEGPGTTGAQVVRSARLKWTGTEPPHLGFGSLDAVLLTMTDKSVFANGEQSVTAPAGVAEEHGVQTIKFAGTRSGGTLSGTVTVVYNATHIRGGATTSTIERRWTANFTGTIDADGNVAIDAPGDGSSRQSYAPVDGVELAPDDYAWTFAWKASGALTTN